MKKKPSDPLTTDIDKRLTVLGNIDDEDWDDEDDEDWDGRDEQSDEDDDWEDDDDEDEDDGEQDVAPAQAVQKRAGKPTPNNLSSF